MTIETTTPLHRNVRRIIPVLAVLLASNATRPAVADDWGAYSIVPASAPAFVLEAAGSGTNEGTVVSIGKPAGSSNQKWVIAPRGNDRYSIKPSPNSNVVLAVSQGGVRNGTPIVLESDQGQPWQEWVLKKNENGSYCLIPSHAPEQGLDHFGGKPNPGAKIDLWINNPGDQHLQWLIKPLAGSLTQVASGGSRNTAQHVRRARDQAGRDPQRRNQELHVLE